MPVPAGAVQPTSWSLAEVLREIRENALSLAGLDGHAVGDHPIDDDGPFVACLPLLGDHLEAVTDDATPGHHLLITVPRQGVRVLCPHSGWREGTSGGRRPAPSPAERDSEDKRGH